MNMTIKKFISRLTRFLVSLALILTVTVSIAGVCIRITSPEPYNVISLAKGWTNESGSPFKLDSFNAHDIKMPPQRIYLTLETVSQDSSIILRCRNCYCNIYIDGELVHKDRINDNKIYGSSPGSRWHIVAVNASDRPVNLCLEVRTCFYNADGLIDNIYLGEAEDVYRKVTSSRLAGFIVSTFLHLISIVILLLYAYAKKYYHVNPDLLYLGIAAFFSAQWSSAESYLWQLFMGYSEVFHLIGYLSLGAIPLSFGVLSYYRLDGRFKKFSKGFSIVSAINLITIITLHITGIREFHFTLPFTHILVVAIIPMMIKVALSYTTEDEDSNQKIRDIIVYTLLALLIICLLTAVLKYTFGFYSDYSSYIRIAIICFLFCLIILQIKQLASTFSKGLKADMLHDMALTDHMTGLYNRTAFNEHTSDYNYAIDSFSPLGVIQFDVNNLKTVNDTLGHEKGDQMITAVAEGLKLAFQDGCKTYRTGGDEFLTIIRSSDPVSVYNEGIKVLQEYCLEKNRQSDLGFKLRIAHGFVLVKGNLSLSEAIEEADTLMYENKREIKQQE